jgi:hypothetical protein
MYRQYSAIADLHTFQFTVPYALIFSVSSSRLLATDLNTETITSSLKILHIISSNRILYPHRPTSCSLLYSGSTLLCSRDSTATISSSLPAQEFYSQGSDIASRKTHVTWSLPLLLCEVTARALHSNGPSADVENTAPVLLAACVLRALSSNGRCLQIHCLATGLYATVFFDKILKAAFTNLNKVTTSI